MENKLLTQLTNHFDRKEFSVEIYPVNEHDCGITDMFVLIANWNDQIPIKDELIDLLESQWSRDRGVTIGYYDEYVICTDCGTASYTKEYHSIGNYITLESECLCRNCAQKRAYEIVEEAQNNSKAAIPHWMACKLVKEDYLELIENNFKQAFGESWNSTPEQILMEYIQDATSGTKYVFSLDKVHPFANYFSIYKVK